MKIRNNILIVQLIVLVVLSSSLVIATKPLPSNYGTYEYANKTIAYAEKSILTAEEKIKFVEEKGLKNIVTLENYEVAKKGFETVVSRIPERKKSLETAKEYFNKGDYFNANKYAVSADAEVSALNNILEDRVTPYGIRVQIVEEINKTESKQPIAPLEGVKYEVGYEIGATPEDCDEYLKDCKLGNSISCLKWGSNCKKTSQCDEYLKACKLGDTEACKKWDLNCIASQCGEYLRDCKLGNSESCTKWDLNCRNK